MVKKCKSVKKLFECFLSCHLHNKEKNPFRVYGNTLLYNGKILAVKGYRCVYFSEHLPNFFEWERKRLKRYVTSLKKAAKAEYVKWEETDTLLLGKADSMRESIANGGFLSFISHEATAQQFMYDELFKWLKGAYGDLGVGHGIKCRLTRFSKKLHEQAVRDGGRAYVL